MPQDLQEEHIMSNVHLLSIFQDVISQMNDVEISKTQKKGEYSAPEMCFHLDGHKSVKTIHEANDQYHNNSTSVLPSTMASVATL